MPNPSTPSCLEGLNLAQLEAVLHDEGPLLILVGGVRPNYASGGLVLVITQAPALPGFCLHQHRVSGLWLSDTIRALFPRLISTLPPTW